MTAVQVQFAVNDAALADRIVEDLLDRRLVACGQRLGPVTSRYWWKGVQEVSEEWLVILKTRQAIAGAVVESVRAVHPYETAEILVLPVLGGNRSYLAWIEEETGNAGA
jgi:periplasmic divalent cation tolerance protein